MTSTGNKKRIIIPLIVGLLIAGAVFIFWISSEDKIHPGMIKSDSVPAMTDEKTVQAGTETVTEWYRAVGTVQPSSQARIEAQISGQVKEVRVNAGDQVRAGQLLMLLDDRQMQSRLSQAKQSLKTSISNKEQAGQAVNAATAAFAEARSAYNRVNSFFNADAATEQALEQARSLYLQSEAALKRSKDGLSGASAGVRMAEEMVQEAKIALDYTEIKAPSDGEVLKRLIDPGDLAMPGKPLLLLRTAGGLRLEAYVRESLIRKVRPGSKLQVELVTLQKTVDATVEELIPYADPQTRTFLVKTQLPDVPGLYPGMYGKLLIPYRQVALVMIPQSAVYKIGQLENVQVRTHTGWRKRYIKTGKTHKDKVEVLSGLKGDETLKIKVTDNDK